VITPSVMQHSSSFSRLTPRPVSCSRCCSTPWVCWPALAVCSGGSGGADPESCRSLETAAVERHETAAPCWGMALGAGLLPGKLRWVLRFPVSAAVCLAVALEMLPVNAAAPPLPLNRPAALALV